MAGKGYQLRLVRTKADGVDDADPNTLAPAETNLWKPETYRESGNRPITTLGFRAKLVFDVAGVNTADVQVWVRNESDSTWALGGTLTALIDSQMIIHDDIGDGVVYFRLMNITGGNPIEVWAEEA